MFKFFNKKDKMQPAQKENEHAHPLIQKKAELLVSFYQQHQSLFQGYFDGEHTQQSKKQLIKDVYDIIGYTNPTKSNRPEISCLQLYRGLRADTGSDILKYTNDFVNGDIVFGQKAALHGTGIYMTTNIEIANKYSQYDNSFGSTISCQVQDGINMINDEELRDLQKEITQCMRNEYSMDVGIQQFTTLLDDNGLFAALSGYDAINIPSREFVLLLNREMVFVDDVTYCMAQKMDDISKDKNEIGEGESFELDLGGR